MANMKLLAVFTRMVEDVEHTSVGHPSAGLRPEGLKPALRDPIWERLGPQGSGVGGVVGFLEEVALRWGLAEPTRQPDQLPPPLPGPGRAPALRIPPAHAQQDPLDRVEPDPTFFAAPMPRHCGPSGPCLPAGPGDPQRTEFTPNPSAEAPPGDRAIPHLLARRRDAGLEPAALCPRRSAEFKPPAYETLLFVHE